ncbi:MAG: hypothetical protein AAGA58_01015 [Verrucomicrobiota bacterium]
MGLIDKAERKFGRFAFSGLIRAIAGFQFLVWCLLWIDQEAAFIKYLYLDPGLILQGQIWRVFGYMIMPAWGVSSAGPSILALITIYFLWFIGEGLEQAWGAFRTNLYILSGAFFCFIAASLLFALFPSELRGEVAFVASIWSSSAFFSTILFAFACNYPDLEIRLMLVIPIKMKWVALISAGVILFSAVGNTIYAFFMLIALMNFFIVYVPQFAKFMKHRSTVAARRSRFESEKISDSEPLHRCDRCGITDVDRPEVEFRVSSEGEDICELCRPDLKKKE